MEVQLDLFGEEYSLWSVLWLQIEMGHEASRLARYRRFQFLDTLADGRTLWLTTEMRILLEEVRSTFVNGEFTATLLLALSFIEHWVSPRMVHRRQSKTAARARISDILKHLQKTGELPPFLIECIDRLRDVRNPFTHPMLGAGHRIDLVSRGVELNDRLFLEREARRAVGLLYAVVAYLPDPWPVHDRTGTEMRKAWLDDPNWQVPGDLPPTHYGMFSPAMLRRGSRRGT